LTRVRKVRPVTTMPMMFEPLPVLSGEAFADSRANFELDADYRSLERAMRWSVELGLLSAGMPVLALMFMAGSISIWNVDMQDRNFMSCSTLFIWWGSGLISLLLFVHSERKAKILGYLRSLRLYRTIVVASLTMSALFIFLGCAVLAYFMVNMD
jgi:hypothetical protein